MTHLIFSVIVFKTQQLSFLRGSHDLFKPETRCEVNKAVWQYFPCGKYTLSEFEFVFSSFQFGQFLIYILSHYPSWNCIFLKKETLPKVKCGSKKSKLRNKCHYGKFFANNNLPWTQITSKYRYVMYTRWVNKNYTRLNVLQYFNVLTFTRDFDINIFHSSSVSFGSSFIKSFVMHDRTWEN